MSDYKEITVVMYHYIRNFSASRYPEIKGLEIRDFKRQLNLLQDRCTFVTIEECMEYLDDPASDSSFPSDAALLTFDDGYMEHFTEVFPILSREKIQGVFFPPVRSAAERKALNINKVHFILAASPDPNSLIHELTACIRKYKNEYDLLEPEDYYERVSSREHKYDPINIIKFKRVLQRELPSEVRTRVIDELFNKIVGIREDIFVDELYLTEEHLKCMKRNGMYIGGHGHSHEWMNKQDVHEQEREVTKTREFLGSLGVDIDNWVMSYPFGAYDNSLIQILRANRCKLAFTTRDEKAVLDPDKRFCITRIDTNEID
ncbi:polysaccharide deacetylase family protein [Rhodohalobacter sp. 8-1]|uniref:polysaccharide deacetylase family protein n=1 Tax=Rhodohalobacter sp. 8-1 TaxID=3131972 RepID=UPI0030EDBF5E